MYWFHVHGENDINSTANECECHPCAQCYAMHECFWQFFGLLVADMRRESDQHFLTAPAQCSHIQSVATVCKTGIMVTRSWPVFRSMKPIYLFALQMVLWFLVWTSIEVSLLRKHICFTSMPFLRAGGCIHGIDWKQFSWSQVAYWPSIEVDQ